MANKRFLYGQVYDDIVACIISGKLKPNDKFAYEEELAAQYKVSAITIKKALSLLKNEGIVKRVSGVGTFVSEHALELLTARENSKQNDIGTPRLIGVILEHVSSPFGLEMMYTLDKEAEANGYKLCIRFSYMDQQKEAEEIDFLMSLGVQGLIIMPSHARHYNTKILKLVVEGFPVVLIDKKLDGVPVPAVYNDNEKSMQLIVKRLYESGHREIGLITTKPHTVSSLIQRESGFHFNMEKYGLKAATECLLDMDENLSKNIGSLPKNPKNIEKLEQYFSANKQLTAVVSLEFGLLSDLEYLLKQRKRRIPEDVSIITFDENYDQVSEFFYTHIKQDESGIGKKAIELMLEYLEKAKTPVAKSYKIPPVFMEGKSVGTI